MSADGQGSSYWLSPLIGQLGSESDVWKEFLLSPDIYNINLERRYIGTK